MIQILLSISRALVVFYYATVDYLYLISIFSSEEEGVIIINLESVVRYIYVLASVFGWSPISGFNHYILNLLKLMANVMISQYRTIQHVIRKIKGLKMHKLVFFFIYTFRIF